MIPIHEITTSKYVHDTSPIGELHSADWEQETVEES